ncbi:MAG: NADH-quinone oxidoreductase subunit L [candidate division NC10 bacterium]|nr:NADH-quinone oxidoreductase subunit L [candidate division NC10 bacterium]MDE2321293.1 NADH-quinone oxidoreductase subunit L [candidate division NC10 bacterium]
MKLVALVPLLPLIGVLINGLFGAWIKERAHLIAVPAAGLSCLVAFVVFFQTLGGATLDWDVYSWLKVGDLKVPIGFLVDPLSTVMMLVVTFVGFLIHVYSIGYMHGDRGYARFFTYLNLFMFSMLMLVLANNYLLMFLGWEGVGLCSYLLIGFWYEKKSAADAGKKAFVVNRIGDAGFILGLFLIWTTFGSLKYTEVFAAVNPALGAGIYTAITLLLFVGATGKSAQLPLYVWLPDAMEGPTPVSALIHAATMVTAGVYMVARSNALFNLAPFSLEVVAWVGALTAVFSATIALVQNDIKRVVAYSTISQLGYMFLGAGAGAYPSAVFHLGTHAFFKALLFLGCGSVIHSLHGEQDMRKMGGLRKAMPITTWTFLLASLANAGIFPLAGFWSKDEILFNVFERGLTIPWLLGLIGAFLTAFYMFRLFFQVFTGHFRGDHHTAHHLHESPPNMAYPLLVLGVLSVIAGLAFGFPPDHGLYHRFVAPIFEVAHESEAATEHAAGASEVVMAAVSLAVALLGIGLAYLFYVKRPDLPAALADKAQGLHSLLLNKYWVDELYQAIFIDFGKAFCRFLWGVDARVVDGAVNGSSWLTMRLSVISSWNDMKIVDGLVNAIADLIQGGSGTLRRLQTGAIQNYILAMALGIVGMVVFYLFL